MIIYLESRNLKLKSQMLWNGWFQLGVSLLYVKIFKATSERSVSHNKPLIIMLFLLMVAMVAAFPGYSSSQFVRKGAFDKLKRVEGWPIDLKKFDTGNYTSTAIGVDAKGNKVIFIAQRKEHAYEDSILGFTPDGNFVRSFGHGLIGSPHGTYIHWKAGQSWDMWVTDIKEHTVLNIDWRDGMLEGSYGVHGKAGTRVHPTLMFGNVADVAVSDDGSIFISDGDGGVNNRVVKLNESKQVEWVLDRGFGSPHSIAWERERNYIWVADRSNNRTQTFDADSGKFIQEWTCMRNIDPQSSENISPWGLRIDNDRGEIVMAAGTRSGTHGHLLVLPISECAILQDITIGLTDKPHELSIDQENGDVYLANIGVPSSVMKFVRTT